MIGYFHHCRKGSQSGKLVTSSSPSPLTYSPCSVASKGSAKFWRRGHCLFLFKRFSAYLNTELFHMALNIRFYETYFEKCYSVCSHIFILITQLSEYFYQQFFSFTSLERKWTWVIYCIVETYHLDLVHTWNFSHQYIFNFRLLFWLFLNV